MTFGAIVTFCAICLTATMAVYEIIPDRMETAFGDDDQLFAFNTLRVKKFNRTTFVVNGLFTVKQDLGNDLEVYAAGLNYQGGQYKRMVVKEFRNFCDAFYMEPSRKIYEHYQSHTTHPVPWKTCPYPAGQNEVKNFYVDDKLLHLPPYLPGSEKWKIEFRLLRKGKVLGGYNLYAKLQTEASLLGF